MTRVLCVWMAQSIVDQGLIYSLLPRLCSKTLSVFVEVDTICYGNKNRKLLLLIQEKFAQVLGWGESINGPLSL